MRRRVVTTGIGLLTPLGLDRESSWQALLAGKSGIGPISRFDASDYSCRIAGEVRGFDAQGVMAKKDVRKTDPFTHFAVAAAHEALADAGYEINASSAERIGVYIGSGIGGLQLLEKQHAVLTTRGPRRVSLHCDSGYFCPTSSTNLPLCHRSTRTIVKRAKAIPAKRTAVPTNFKGVSHAFTAAMRPNCASRSDPSGAASMVAMEFP